MPRHLIEEELRDGRLLSIAGRHFKGGQAELVAARRRNTPHGPVANRLWRYIEEQAAELIAAIKVPPTAAQKSRRRITRRGR
jgi:hypothetical protein